MVVDGMANASDGRQGEEDLRWPRAAALSAVDDKASAYQIAAFSCQSL